MEMNDFFSNVILTATVFAALTTSVANVIISLINNHRLKIIEAKKRTNEIDKYRYGRLYELVLNWHRYDSPVKGKTASKIAFYKLLNLFLDDSGRYEIAKPFLDKCYIENLENKKTECTKLLDELVDAEAPDGTHTKDFQIIKEKYFANGMQFSEMLKNAINSQLESLLERNEI